MVVRPDAEVAVRNAAFGKNAGGFDNNQSEATESETTQMDDVIIVHEAIRRRILTHGRNHDAVTEFHTADGDGLEQSHDTSSIHRCPAGVDDQRSESRDAVAAVGQQAVTGDEGTVVGGEES